MRVRFRSWYVSQLKKEDQIDLYATFLFTLNHKADKRLALSLAIENSLPIHEILSEVVKRIHDEDCSDDNDEQLVARLILRKINALEWLLYDAKQMDEAIERGNLLIRKLKATGNTEFAKNAFDKLPENASEIVNKDCVDEDQEMSAWQHLVVKEYLCWSAYFSAKSANV